MHKPSCRRPVRPRRWSTLLCVMRVVLSTSALLNALNSIVFWRPLSITTLMYGMVTEVSAMFVERMMRGRREHHALFLQRQHGVQQQHVVVLLHKPPFLQERAQPTDLLPARQKHQDVL